MGYNLSVGCLTHRVQCSALRGEEALVIKRFGALHPRSEGCVRDVSIDNGYAEKPWSDGPNAFPDAYDEVMGYAEREGECAECGGAGWLGGEDGHECDACYGNGKLAPPSMTAPSHGTQA